MRIQKTFLVQIGLAIIASITALLVSFHFTSPQQAVHIIKFCGLWLTLATFLIFIFELRTPIKHLRWNNITEGLRSHWPALILILCATGYLHLHIDRSFKILYDEHTLSSTAMNFYIDGQAFVQAASHQMNGEVITQAGFVDKRPSFFPFCVAILHQLTGFRPSNAFWLNSGLTGLLLTLVYLIVQRVCDKKHACLSIILLSSLPLFAQNTTGGGYELLNLCLISSLILAGMYYLQAEGNKGLNLLIIIGVLLASTRYESILYTLVPVLLWGIKSLRNQKFTLTWFAALSPLTLIPPLLSYSIFKSDNRFIQTTNENFFSLKHLAHNLREATHYLFDLHGNFSNSALLSTVGFISLLIIAIFVIRRLHSLHIANDSFYTLAAVSAIVALNTSLALTCYWGAWTDPTTSRFSLPLQLLFAITPSLVLYHCLKSKNVWLWLSIVSIAFTATISSATSIRINKETRILIPMGNHWAQNWLNKNIPKETNLIISDGAIGIQLYNYPAIPIIVANSMPERVLNLQNIGFYDKLYVVEGLVNFGNAYEMLPPPTANRLSERFILKHLAQKAFSKNSFYRISQIIGLHEADSTNTTLPQNLPPKDMPPKDDPDAFQVYLKEALPLIPHK